MDRTMKQSRFPLAMREHVPLAPFTTLGIGGPARHFAEAETESHVVEALDFARKRLLPVFVLGGGSNILVSDAGFKGLVLRIALRGIRRKGDDLVVACAGEEWDYFVRWCVERNLAGIECLSGIPGSVGGTPVQNVGAYGQEVGEIITMVRAWDRARQQALELTAQDCGFAYRSSVFNAAGRNRYIVLSVTFALRPGAAPRTTYPDLIRHFADRPNPPGLVDMREAVLEIRRSKSMVIRPEDPNAKSAGSFFKNPFVPEQLAMRAEEAARARGSLQRSEIMPRYPMKDGSVKLSAAWLIERAGFSRGYGTGRVGLSSRHTLALVNRGGATAEELLGLMHKIQDEVRAIFGVILEPEPVFVGFEN
jgi:UDP-N-acetylmuramate dehydrogenase